MNKKIWKEYITLTGALLALSISGCMSFEDVKREADNGNSEMQYKAAVMLKNGDGVTADSKLSDIYMEKAAVSGNIMAACDLAEKIYMNQEYDKVDTFLRCYSYIFVNQSLSWSEFKRVLRMKQTYPDMCISMASNMMNTGKEKEAWAFRNKSITYITRENCDCRGKEARRYKEKLNSIVAPYELKLKQEKDQKAREEQRRMEEERRQKELAEQKRMEEERRQKELAAQRRMEEERRQKEFAEQKRIEKLAQEKAEQRKTAVKLCNGVYSCSLDYAFDKENLASSKQDWARINFMGKPFSIQEIRKSGIVYYVDSNTKKVAGVKIDIQNIEQSDLIEKVKRDYCNVPFKKGIHTSSIELKTEQYRITMPFNLKADFETLIWENEAYCIELITPYFQNGKVEKESNALLDLTIKATKDSFRQQYGIVPEEIDNLDNITYAEAQAKKIAEHPSKTFSLVIFSTTEFKAIVNREKQEKQKKLKEEEEKKKAEKQKALDF